VGYKYAKDYQQNNACPGEKGKEADTCIKIGTTLPQKSDQSLEKDTYAKVAAFHKLMVSKNISWRITEAWPMTSTHQSKCHRNGTCLDLNFTSTPQTPQNVKLMIDSLISVGMCPNYEVMPSGGITRAQLTAIGIPNERIWNGKGTAAHIHVVNATCL
jgi:hypothetical protein